MQEVRPSQLILRCYGHRRPDGSWFMICLDLNLDAEAPSLPQAKKSLEDAIVSYLETVLEGEKDTWPTLIQRRAALRHWIKYYMIKLLTDVKRGIDSAITFKEPIPISLARSCA